MLYLWFGLGFYVWGCVCQTKTSLPPGSAAVPSGAGACLSVPGLNIPGWVVTVTKQAVPLSGCPFLHFKGWLGSAVLPVGAAHSIIFGSGGEMRFGVSTHHSLLILDPSQEKEEPTTMTQMDGQCTTNFVCVCVSCVRGRGEGGTLPAGRPLVPCAGQACWSCPGYTQHRLLLTSHLSFAFY